MGKREFTLDIKDGIATVTLNWADRVNAMGLDFSTDFGRVLDRIEAHSGVRVMILASASARCCASAAIELMLVGTRYSLQAYADRNPAQFSIGASALSPMPGVVVSLPAKLGQTVSEGEVLAIVEAMKMENKVTAAFAGTVPAINCRLNETVNAGDLLVTVEPSE